MIRSFANRVKSIVTNASHNPIVGATITAAPGASIVYASEQAGLLNSKKTSDKSPSNKTDAKTVQSQDREYTLLFGE